MALAWRAGGAGSGGVHHVVAHLGARHRIGHSSFIEALNSLLHAAAKRRSPRPALEHPNSITVGASGQRMSVALAADVLEPAVDAAASAQAANSLEKMLCHQSGGGL